MEKITYYFVSKKNKSGDYTGYFGKGYKFMSEFAYGNGDWWDIKEYGYIDKSTANKVAKRHSKNDTEYIWGVKNMEITFDTKEQKREFIDRFLYGIKDKIRDKLLKECE